MKTPTIEEIKVQIASEYGSKDYQRDYEYGLGISKMMGEFEFMERVCESHTQAHTKELESKYRQLKKHNTACRYLCGELREVIHEDNTKAEKLKHQLQYELKISMDRIKELEALMQEFIDRVDRGEVRSKRTYAKFKEALK